MPDHVLEATQYPQEPQADTVRRMGVLAEVADDQFHRREADYEPAVPEMYGRLWGLIDRLIDCAGAPTPAYREVLIQIAGTAVGGALAFDRQHDQPEGMPS